MGINLTSNFTEQAALPLDDRFIFADTTARDALAAGRRYKGMICWVLADEVHYKLKNDLVTWEELSGSGSSIPDFVGDSGLGGTAGLVPAPAAGDGVAHYLKADGTWEIPPDTTYSDMVGDSGAGGVHGLVPAPIAGDAAAGKYLKADGTWATPPAVGSGVGGSTIGYQYIKYSGATHASSNDAIPYYTTQDVNTGSDLLTIENSSSLGLSFTAKKRCLVTMSCSASADGTLDSIIGISLNSTQLSVDVVAANGILAYSLVEYSDVFESAGTRGGTCVCVSLVLEEDDVIRQHNDKDFDTTNETLEITAVDLETEIGIVYAPFTGDTGTGGTEGLVPAPAAGDANKVLKGDGTWGYPPASLPLMYGTGAPSLLLDVPAGDPALYYDTSTTANGFVTLWLYSTVLGNWYPIKTDYLAKHLAEAIEFVENLVKTRIRPLLDAITLSEILYKTRLRPIPEGIIISESLVVLVLTSSSPEINGHAINGAPL